MLGENGLQGLIDERGLSATADTRDDNQFSKWEGDVDMLEIVACGTFDDKVFS